jgi:hypothetical protein
LLVKLAAKKEIAEPWFDAGHRPLNWVFRSKRLVEDWLRKRYDDRWRGEADFAKGIWF